MYRRKVWERVGGYRTRCRTAEDADFWCRATILGFKPKNITSAPLFIYRNRNDSMSHTEADWDWTAWFPMHRIPMAVNPHKVPTNEPCIISVIVPVGPGHETKVIDAIDSIWAQSLDKWEIIVIDDNNTDYWLPPSVRRFRTNTPTSGPAVSRNIGIDNARGKYVLFLDADDFLQPSALLKMYEAIKDHPGYYAYCDW